LTYVFVLASDARDLYYEQAFLALTSLRLVMPNARAAVLVDKRTEKTLTGKRRAIYDLAEIVPVDVDPSFSKKECSRFIKTSMGKYVSGNFLYIDCDTIVCGDISNIENCGFEIGGVPDMHMPLAVHARRTEIENVDKRFGFSSAQSLPLHFNGGVMYCADTPAVHTFFDNWNRLWLFCKGKGFTNDQASLNQSNYLGNGIIKELDGSWNCQIAANGLKYLANAKIIHYFATSLISFQPPYLPADESVLQYIHENGSIDTKTQDLLRNPKSAFRENVLLVSDSAERTVMNSVMFAKMFRLCKRNEKAFRGLDKFVSYFKKPWK
jgi:hypothetical protein